MLTTLDPSLPSMIDVFRFLKMPDYKKFAYKYPVRKVPHASFWASYYGYLPGDLLLDAQGEDSRGGSLLKGAS